LMPLYLILGVSLRSSAWFLRLGFQSGVLARRALSERRRASARSRPPVEDSPLIAPVSNLGSFPVKLGLVFGARFQSGRSNQFANSSTALENSALSSLVSWRAR
jgi:hypothetical protein